MNRKKARAATDYYYYYHFSIVCPIHAGNHPLQEVADEAASRRFRRRRRRRRRYATRKGNSGTTSGQSVHHLLVPGPRLGRGDFVGDDVDTVDTALEDHEVQPHFEHDQLLIGLLCEWRGEIVDDLFFYFQNLNDDKGVEVLDPSKIRVTCLQR